ncbi:hypothetical protein ACVIHI_008310 [Bradyrhizobium sp. USDA 4524]
MVRRNFTVQLPEMIGNAGEVLRQAAEPAVARKINLTFWTLTIRSCTSPSILKICPNIPSVGGRHPA